MVKLSTENSYLKANIFYFDELRLPIKISEEISLGVKYSQIIFFHKRAFGFFVIQLIAHEILIHVLHHIFHFLLEKKKLHKKVIKAKLRKTEHRFVNYDLTKFERDRRNIAVVVGLWKIVQSIFYKNPDHKTHANIDFKL